MVGGVAGLGAAASGALLLHPTEGALGSLGFVAALLLGALAAGLWAGPAGPISPDISRQELVAGARLRWLIAVATFAGASLFLQLRAGGAMLPVEARDRGLAVLLLVAAPGYVVGWLLAALGGRGRLETSGSGSGAGVAPAAFGGAAVGVLLASVVLIPRVDPQFLFAGGALLLALMGMLDVRFAAVPRRSGRGLMRNKAVLITGVGRRGQIGFSLAEAFLAEGAEIIITGPHAGIERSVGALSADGNVTAIRADLSNPLEVEALIDEVKRRPGRLDILINAAGGLSVIKPLAETSPEEWRAELERNATTAFLTCRAALPLLRQSRGSIINFASPAGLRARAGIGAYSAAKAGVIALTQSLAVEERSHGVRVNAILPGLVDTESNRQSVADPDRVKWVTRAEIARVALFLAGEEAAGISGEAIHVLGEGLE